jgi:hypothetical protein
MSAAGPSKHAGMQAASGGSAVAALVNAATSVGAMSAAGPSQGANRAPSGGSAVAALVNAATSVGAL